MTTAQIGKPAVVAIGCYPFASGLNGKSCQKCVRGEVAFHSGFPAKLYENIPMPRTGINVRAVARLADLFTEFQRINHRAGRFEYCWMRNDTKEAARYDIRNAIGLITIDEIFKPFL